MQTKESNTADREIRMNRLLHAPVELVWKVWTDPEHIKNWWGPNGFTNTFHIFDFRVGGRWSFTMHGPEKGNYENECEFLIIEQPFLIAWKRISKPLFNVVAGFEEVASNQTRIVFRQIFSTVAECNKIKPFAVEKNEENFDRLERELEKMI